MKRVFIGHRGVGKSSLLERHQGYFPDVPAFDLDQVITDKENQPVSEIFAQQGETVFRNLEKKYFHELIAYSSYVIAVGAGFNTELLPADAEVVLVSRRTDSDGRIFLNRPRLNPEVSALQESLLRYQEREPKFRKAASWVYHLPEGLNESDETEEKLFKKDFKTESAYFTLAKESEIKLWSNLDKFELRTDVFSVEDIKRIIAAYKETRFLVAIRSQVAATELRGLRVDWALEYGPVPPGVNAQIISLHDGEFFEGLRIMHQQGRDKHLKFCPVVNSFNELILGVQWQNEDRQNRSFLPRTVAGEKSRWRWYRNLMWRRQKINFVQGLKDNDDQPSFYEYLQGLTAKKQFGAVLGDPVHHSRTPMTQGPNLTDYGQILSIPLNEEEFMQAMSLLQEIGLKFAAVTSPLKRQAAEFIGLSDGESGINSLIYQNNQWHGVSTDGDGFEAMVEESEIADLKNLKIAIWGGGGVVSALKHILPQAEGFSARSGQPRSESTEASFTPDVVIWAAPRKEGVQLPPTTWNPKYILDINYSENSMGLEYAQAVPSAKYFSGLDMFYAQAKAQFKFWAKYLTTEG